MEKVAGLNQTKRGGIFKPLCNDRYGMLIRLIVRISVLICFLAIGSAFAGTIDRIETPDPIWQGSSIIMYTLLYSGQINDNCAHELVFGDNQKFQIDKPVSPEATGGFITASL